MPRLADAENLNVDASVLSDELFVLLAEGVNLFLGELAVRNVDIFVGDVNVVEQVFVHECVVGTLVLSG